MSKTKKLPRRLGVLIRLSAKDYKALKNNAAVKGLPMATLIRTILRGYGLI